MRPFQTSDIENKNSDVLLSDPETRSSCLFARCRCGVAGRRCRWYGAAAGVAAAMKQSTD